MLALGIHQVFKRYGAGLRGCCAGVDALRGLDLQVQPGEVAGVVGAPAAGKSTLLLCASGAMLPDSGTVTWAGRPAARRSPEGGVAYVTDACASYPFFTVRDVLEHHPHLQALTPDERGARLAETIRVADLSPWVNVRMAGAPAGVARRLSIAQALLGAPGLLIVDEPLAGLEIVAQAHLADLLRSLPLRGITVLMASRDGRAIARACTRLIVMSEGRLQGEIDPGRFHQAGRVAEVPR